MLKAIAAWSDTEFVESAAQLRSYVRRRMMPEAAGERITRERVLLQIGVSDGRTLFPCPSMIKEIEAPVRRTIGQTITDKITAGRQYLCMHGSGGAGKTTLLQEIESLLPPGSEMLKFDCYGAGSYQDASALRHRPQDVFVQLANELAQLLRLPMLTPPRATQDYPRLFRRRLDLAASALAQVRPGALLVIAIDAADNSVTAAHSRTPPERSFIHDLMSFEGIPTNTRLLVSARTGRLEELALPSFFEQVPLRPFNRSETRLNVSRFWTTAPEEWVDDIHHLSGGVPRVQAYAFETAGTTPEHAIDALRPVGKKLDQIFRERFQLALRKAGRSGEVQLLCAGLIALPRPIPVSELAAVLAVSTTQIVDLCSDLAPGVRLQGDQINFADEDFEAFVREEAGDAIKAILERAADRLSARATTNAYAALNVAPVADAIAEAQTTVDTILMPRSEPLDEKHRSRSDEASRDRTVEDVIQTVLKLYVLRAKTLSIGRPAAAFAEELVKAQQHFDSQRWRIESRPTALDIRVKASECLTVLLAIGAGPTSLLTTAVKLRGGWASHYGVAPNRLFDRLAAIPSLHPELAQSVAQAAQNTKDARIGAEEKAESLATFARLLTTISPHDAEVFFKDAVNAASEQDSAIFHQLRLIGSLVERGLPAFGDQRRPCARALAETVHDAAVRLEHNEFDWAGAFTGLARLDFSVALAAAARWSDTDRAQLSESLPPIITVGLDQRRLTIADAAVLLGLINKPSSDHLEDFVERAGQDGPAIATQIAEELSHDLLVNRISAFGSLLEFISRQGRGPAAARLAAQSRFLDALDNSAEAGKRAPERVSLAEKPHDILNAHVWAVEDLVDAHRLTERVTDVTTRSHEADQYPTDDAIFAAARNAVPFSRRLDHLKALAGLRG